jgi:hypothetical protein
LIVSPRRFTRTLTAGAAVVSATGLVAAGLLIGAGSSAAVPVSLTQQYTCPFPLIGDQPIKVVVTSDMPATIAVGQATGAFTIKAVSTVSATATQGLNLVGATSIEGTAVSGDLVTAPNLNLPVNVPVTIPNQPVPQDGSAFDLVANGSTPSLTFGQSNVGTAKIFVNSLKLTMTPKKSDGTPTGLGTFDSECRLDTGQPTLLHQFEITGGTPSTAPTTTTVAPPPVTTTTTVAPPPPVTTTTTVAPPPPSGGVAISYGLTGSSTLKNLGGTVALSGSFDALANLSAGTYTGDLKLNPTTGNFKIGGFVPVTSDIKFVPVGSSSGTVTTGAITYSGKLHVKLTKITMYGMPIYQGETCQTVTPSDINLKSVGTFDVLVGGKLGGQYALSKVQGCGSFNDWISPFVESTGNTIDMTLKKK